MDIILYNIIACLLSLIFGYFIGSIPTGVILCRLIYGKDPRDFGSKNSGGTNVGRVFGKKIGLLTIIIDAIKTLLPMILVWVILNYSGLKEVMIRTYGQNFYHDGAWIIMLAPLGATIGHCWPIFSNFRGGKAVASYTGFAASTCYMGFGISVVSFFTTLKITKHVSLSSIIGSTVQTIIAWTLFIIGKLVSTANVNLAFWGFGKVQLWAVSGIEFAVVSTLITLILIIRHIPNIKRLISGTESKIKWMK